MSGASSPSLQHTPYACNTHCWLCLGYMPRPLSPVPPHRAAQLEQMRNIPGRESYGPQLHAPVPSITPGSGHTAPDLPLILSTLTSCLCTPILAASEPHIWLKSAPPSAHPCLVVPRARAGRDSCSPTAGARVESRGNRRWRGSLHPQRHPQLHAAVAWEREGGYLSL